MWCPLCQDESSIGSKALSVGTVLDGIGDSEHSEIVKSPSAQGMWFNLVLIGGEASSLEMFGFSAKLQAERLKQGPGYLRGPVSNGLAREAKQNSRPHEPSGWLFPGSAGRAYGLQLITTNTMNVNC